LTHQLQTSQTVLAMLSYPGTQTISINAGAVTGTLLLDEDRNVATLVLWDMPQLSANQTYQMWLIDPKGDRTSAGIFQPESGQQFTSVSISSQKSLSNFVGIGVTVEPAGGSDQPTGARIFKVGF
jgi:anti-sigma-K factor RskA